jgi:hypothetical protein
MSAIRRGGIGLEDAATFYGALNQHQDKEAIWEQIRLKDFGSLPTRQHALFLFNDEEQASTACKSWFVGQDRVIVEARIVRGATFHRADAVWLEGKPETWPLNAANYWRGKMTAYPRPEVIVDGAVYFPDWREKPFGLFAGLFPEEPSQGDNTAS